MTVVRRLRTVDGSSKDAVGNLCAASVPWPVPKPVDFPETGPGQSILRILSDRFRPEVVGRL